MNKPQETPEPARAYAILTAKNGEHTSTIAFGGIDVFIGRSEVEALKLAGWCKDLPVYSADKALPVEVWNTLLMLGYLRLNKAGNSYRMTVSGKSVLESMGYRYPADKYYRGAGTKLNKRLCMSEIVLSFYRMGADVFLEKPELVASRPRYLPGFILRRKSKEEISDVLGGSTFAGVLFTRDVAYIPFYIAAGHGIVPGLEERLFTAHTISLGMKTGILYTGSHSLEILDETFCREFVGKKRGSKVSYREAAMQFAYPVFHVPLSDSGLRQLRILCQTDYRAIIARAMLGSEFDLPDSRHCDARYLGSGEPFLVAIDMELRRFDEAIQVFRETPLHVLALEDQASFLKKRLRGKNVRLHTVPTEAIEELFGLEPALYLPPEEPYVTEKGGYILAPPICVRQRVEKQGGGHIQES